MIRNKNIFLILSAILLLLLFAACSNARHGSVQPTNMATALQTTDETTAGRTATPEATMEVTPQITETPTVEPTMTPTLTPTPTVTPKVIPSVQTVAPKATISKAPVAVKTQTPKKEPTATPKVTASNAEKKVVAISRLAVRKYAGTEYTVLGYLDYLDVITVKGHTSDGWYKITFDGRTGYVDGAFLKKYPYKPATAPTDTPMWKYTPTIIIPETPTPETPTPETPTPEITTLETPTPETPIPETPTPETPTSETLSPGAPTEAQETTTPMMTVTPIETEAPTATPELTATQTATPIVIKGTAYEKTDYVNPYKAYTYDAMMQDIRQLTTYYDFVETGSIGESFLGREIPYLKIGNGSKKLFLCASMHAREYITSSYIMEIVETYAYYYANDMTYGSFQVKDLLNTYSLWIVPMVNPDGVTIVTDPSNVDLDQLASYVGSNWIGSDTLIKWKANGRGVDLNRNFNVAWSKLKNGTTNPAYMNYKGPSAASEPETQAIVAFCNKHRFAAAISLHTKGEVVYWEDSYSGTVSKAEAFTDAICNLTGYLRIPTTTSSSGYAGGFENWFRYAYDRPALCVELTPSANGEKPHDPAKFDSLVWNKAKYLPLVAIEGLL